MGFWSDLFGGKKQEAKEEPASSAPATEKAQAPPEPKPEPEPPRPAPPPKPKPETRKQAQQQEEDEDMEGVQRLLSRKVERVLEQLGAMAARARTGESVQVLAKHQNQHQLA